MEARQILLAAPTHDTAHFLCQNLVSPFLCFASLPRPFAQSYAVLPPHLRNPGAAVTHTLFLGAHRRVPASASDPEPAGFRNLDGSRLQPAAAAWAAGEPDGRAGLGDGGGAVLGGGRRACLAVAVTWSAAGVLTGLQLGDEDCGSRLGVLCQGEWLGVLRRGTHGSFHGGMGISSWTLV